MAEAEFGAAHNAVTHLSRVLHLLEDPSAAAVARLLLDVLAAAVSPDSSAAAS
jgi:hypothetical protein